MPEAAQLADSQFAAHLWVAFPGDVDKALEQQPLPEHLLAQRGQTGGSMINLLDIRYVRLGTRGALGEVRLH